MTLVSWTRASLERFVSLNSLYSSYSEMLSSQSLHFDELMLSCHFKVDAKMEKRIVKTISDDY